MGHISEGLKLVLPDATGIIKSPVKKFNELKKRNAADVLLYIFATSAVYAVLYGLMTLIGYDIIDAYGFLKPFGTWRMIFLIYLMSVGSIFLNSAIIHVFVIIVEGKKGLFESLKVVAYANTPSFLFGWIPVAGILASIWALVLETLAIRELHEISTGRAVIAMILPYIISVCIFISLFFIPAPYPIMK
nr:YIP1 family protein [Methanomicrobium sp. W14]